MRIGIIGNFRKEETPRAIRQLTEILRKKEIDYLLEDRLSATFPELRDVGDTISRDEISTQIDLAFAFGGDGTMLSTGRLLAGSNVPIVGFNLGKLGFLAEFSVENLEQTVEEVIGGDCRIVERSLLEARFPENPEKEPLIALNDIVVDKREKRLMITLAVHVDGEYLGSYNADGLILATPTGSTAYGLAVGGPVIVPSANVTLLAPIAPHMLTARPVVLPETSVIEVVPEVGRNEDDSVHVYADGQNHHYLELPAKIVVTRFQHSVRLVKKASRSYYDVLRAKLLWGREPLLESNEKRLRGS